jgi:hypothetical protein
MSAAPVDEQIRWKTERNVACYAALGPKAIERRMRELDREWALEKVLLTGASSLTLLGLTLGLTRNRRWLLVPAMTGVFLLQDVVQDSSPVSGLLRRLGLRKLREIEEERYALKVLRGDFQDLPRPEAKEHRSAVEAALNAVRN